VNVIFSYNIIYPTPCIIQMAHPGSAPGAVANRPAWPGLAEVDPGLGLPLARDGRFGRRPRHKKLPISPYKVAMDYSP